MRKHRPSPLFLTAVVLLLAAAPIAAAGEPRGDGKSTPERPRVVRIGAVAYAPSAVTIFEDIRRYFDRRGMPVDYVLFSHYDALVQALSKGRGGYCMEHAAGARPVPPQGRQRQPGPGDARRRL